MRTVALGLAKTIMRPAMEKPIRNLTPQVTPDLESLQSDTVSVGLGPISFKAKTKTVEPAVKGLSEGIGVAAGTLAGTVATATGMMCYPATAVAVGLATAATCVTADVEGQTMLVRGAKRAALAATLAPTAALFAPAVLGAAVAVVTEDVVSQGVEYGIHNYLLSDPIASQKD